MDDTPTFNADSTLLVTWIIAPSYSKTWTFLSDWKATLKLRLVSLSTTVTPLVARAVVMIPFWSAFKVAGSLSRSSAIAGSAATGRRSATVLVARSGWKTSKTGKGMSEAVAKTRSTGVPLATRVRAGMLCETATGTRVRRMGTVWGMKSVTRTGLKGGGATSRPSRTMTGGGALPLTSTNGRKEALARSAGLIAPAEIAERAELAEIDAELAEIAAAGAALAAAAAIAGLIATLVAESAGGTASASALKVGLARNLDMGLSFSGSVR